jgi:hypothetical protein
MSKKAQIFSLDAVLSIVGFIVVFVFLLSLWNLYSIRLQENIITEELNLLAFQITDVFTKTAGVPNNWENNPSNTSVIGLISSPGFLDGNKLTAFLNLNYNTTRSLLNIERFEYYFEVKDVDGNSLNATGKKIENSTSNSISITHFMLQQNETRQISFTLWK